MLIFNKISWSNYSYLPNDSLRVRYKKQKPLPMQRARTKVLSCPWMISLIFPPMTSPICKPLHPQQNRKIPALRPQLL